MNENKEPRIYMASLEEIINGEATDIYFKRTKEVLEKAGLTDVRVRMEVHLYGRPPEGREWAVYAGLEEAIALLKEKPFTLYSVQRAHIY
jgi:Nicotinic acid phosphoribosyltransferase